MRRKRTVTLELEVSPTIYGQIKRIARAKDQPVEAAGLDLILAELRKRAGAAEGQRKARERGLVLGRPATLDADERKTVRLLRADGYTIRQIAEMYGVTASTVYRAS